MWNRAHMVINYKPNTAMHNECRGQIMFAVEWSEDECQMARMRCHLCVCVIRACNEYHAYAPNARNVLEYLFIKPRAHA